MHKIVYIFALVCSFIFSNLCSKAQETESSTAKTYKPIVYPAGFKANIDEVYTKVGDWDGKLDL